MPSNPIISIKDLNLTFHYHDYPHKRARELFVDLFKGNFFSKTKRSRTIFKNLSLEINEGDKIAVIGRNGQGKTTLFRLISGVIEAPGECVTVNGSVMPLLNPNVGLNYDLSGRENATVLSHLLYHDRDNRKEMLEEALRYCEIDDALDTPIKYYSRGMITRLVLSLHAHFYSDILIFDEVYEGADVFFQKKIEQKFNESIDKAKVTLFVHHNIEVCKKVCNKAIWIDEGEIRSIGSVEKVYNEYESHIESDKKGRA